MKGKLLPVGCNELFGRALAAASSRTLSLNCYCSEPLNTLADAHHPASFARGERQAVMPHSSEKYSRKNPETQAYTLQAQSRGESGRLHNSQNKRATTERWN
jgi:hypothetical protein